MRLLFLLMPLLFFSKTVLAQKRSRLDISIDRNRYLAGKLKDLAADIEAKQSKILLQESTINYYVKALKDSRDSTTALMAKSERDLLRANYKIAALEDSVVAFQKYREKVYREKLKIVNDTNVIRVYDLPLGQVRMRTLRQVLDQGVDLLIERNTDEGFVVSKIYRDRKSPNIFKRHTDTRIEAEIRMIEHPFYPNRTLFYLDIEAQERTKRNKPFVKTTDAAVIDRYEKKLLRFFDEFLVVI